MRKIDSKETEAFLKEYYKPLRDKPGWDEEWERRFQEWLDMLEAAGCELAPGVR